MVSQSARPTSQSAGFEADGGEQSDIRADGPLFLASSKSGMTGSPRTQVKRRRLKAAAASKARNAKNASNANRQRQRPAMLDDLAAQKSESQLCKRVHRSAHSPTSMINVRYNGPSSLKIVSLLHTPHYSRCFRFPHTRCVGRGSNIPLTKGQRQLPVCATRCEHDDCNKCSNVGVNELARWQPSHSFPSPLSFSHFLYELKKPSLDMTKYAHV